MIKNESLEVIKLNSLQMKVKKYSGEHIVLDRKKREHRWRYRKYTLILDDDHQCPPCDYKLINNNDVNEITCMIKGLKDEDNNLIVEFKNIEMEISEKKAFFDYLKEISFD